jgi:NitT/TauT family transport system ATP-binding protein
VRRDSAPPVRSSSTVSAANIPDFPVGTGSRDAPIAAAQPGGGPPGRTPAIELHDITFGYNGATSVVEHVDLVVEPGEVLVLIGPSGCGKSTLLNLIAGIAEPSKGTVACFGGAVQGLNRRVTYMTQRDTLLPWRSALDNACLPLEIKGVGKKERYARARAELARVGVAEAENRKPHQLSGGMRSRLSLACSLLSDADILLMDEPFAAIDALLRVKLQQLLIDVWAETNRTLVYVTHDLSEAIALGHRVVVMGANPGRIAMERRIDEPHPRRIGEFRTTPIAQELYAELWQALEDQMAE